MAIVALTATAVKLGRRLKREFPAARLYVPERHQESLEDGCIMAGGLQTTIASLWDECSQFIFIMAAGIVIRSVAPLLRDKTKDPAVIVMDEKGRFVVPLLSGHLGGANELAAVIGEKTGAVPVITTATDVEGIPALDDLARKNGCVIENMSDWKKIAMSLLEGKNVGMYATVKVKAEFPPQVQIVRLKSCDGTEKDCSGSQENGVNDILESKKLQGMIYITEKEKVVERTGVPYVVLRPRNIIVGVGCRKGKKKSDILVAVRDCLEGLGININSILHLATIDFKREEKGLQEAARELNVPLMCVNAEEIQRVEGKFVGSQFVKKQVGVTAVAEPAAWLTAKEPQVLASKTCYPGITVAIVKDRGAILM